MIQRLAKRMIQKRGKQEERQIYGILCGVVGIGFNVLLFAGKFIAGLLSNSIAITADAFNNLSDAGSSLVTLAGFKLAGTKPDSEHPFGHGRIEYISGLIVSGVILIMAYELIRDSIQKIIHPQETVFSVTSSVILIISILIKLYMAYYNRKIGNQIESAAMRATATDSLSDAAATTVVLLATIIDRLTGLWVDGYCGVLVGLFILNAGIHAAKDTLDPLLGQPPKQEFVKEVTRLVMQAENICGIHDLVVHDYGPGRVMISLHAEVPADGDILKIHDVIDRTEEKIREELGCEAVIHMDPVVTKDPQVTGLKKVVEEFLSEIDEGLSLHDFRVVKGTHTNILFDIVLPYHYRMSDEEIVEQLKRKGEERLGTDYSLIIKVDKAYS